MSLAFALVALAMVAFLGAASSARADGVPFSPGDVLAGVGNGTISHFNSSGTLLDTLDTTSGSRDETGMCFDSAGNLYTTNFETNTMSVFDKNGNLITPSFGSGFNSAPESCVFNQANQMFVGQANGSGQVLQFDTSGNLLNSFSPAPDRRGTDFIDLAADQHTLHYTSEGSLVKQFDVGSNTQLPDFASGLPAPCYAHRILADGGEIVACASEVVRLDPTGAIAQTYPVDPNQNLFALNIDPDGTSFWTADFNGTIYHVDIASGTVITSFNANPVTEVAGLAIVGEKTVAQDPAITATGASGFGATEGAAATGTVATFTDPDTAATAGEYSATIDWGDGSTSPGTVDGSGGSFTVSGSHTYAEEGSYTATATITDTTNAANMATATSTATVADAALHATSSTPTLNGKALSGTVATFTDDDPNGTLSDYTASVSWGDGASSAGTVSAGSGNFAVGASHTYSAFGTFTVTVTIKDGGGSQATATQTVKLTSSPKPKPKPKPKGSGRAKLTGAPSACVVAPVSLQVKGKQIASVKWFVGGSRVTGRTVHRGTSYSTRFSLSPGSHRVTAKVTFRRGSHTRARTFQLKAAGCRIPTPKFTG